jgi:hypothetical protein
MSRIPFPESHILGLDEKEIEHVNKGDCKAASMLSHGQRMCSMSGGFFVVLTWKNQVLIFLKMKTL